MFWLVGLIVAMVGAYLAAWQWDLLPRDVIATGTVTTGDGKVLKTRRIIGPRVKTRTNLPPPAQSREKPSGRWRFRAAGGSTATARTAGQRRSEH